MKIELSKIEEHENGDATFSFEMDEEMENFIKIELKNPSPTDEDYSNYILEMLKEAAN